MRVSGTAISAVVKAWNATVMATGTKATSREANPTAKESTRGQMVKSTKANGRQGSKKVRESGKESWVTHILASGDSRKRQATASISGRTEIATKESG